MRLDLPSLSFLGLLACAPTRLVAQTPAWGAAPDEASVLTMQPARRRDLATARAAAPAPAPPPGPLAVVPAGVPSLRASGGSAGALMPRPSGWPGAAAWRGRRPPAPSRRWYTWGGAALGALTAMTLALHHAEDDPGEDIGSATAPALALAGIAGAGGGYFAGAWLYSVVHDR